MTKMEEELDLNSVKKSLKVLNQEVETSRQEVLRALQSKSADIATASGQVTQLTELLDALTNELQDYQWLPAEPITGGGAGGAGGGPTLQLRPYQVQAAAEAYATGEAQLRASEAAMEVLNVILQAEQLLSELQTSRSFMSSTELLLQVSGLLQSVSAPERMAMEPEMLWTAKERYRKQRLALLTSLDDAFSKHLHFTSGALQVRPAELPELWRCLGLLGVQRTRIEQLAEEVLKQLNGMVIARHLVLEITTAGHTTTFRWRAARGSAVGDDTNTFPPLAAVGKFLSFLGQSCTGEAEVYQVLGFSLYPRLVKLLSRHLEIQEAEAMGFEKHLSSEGFISPKESSLSRWAQQRHQAQKQGPQRLTQARRWILDEAEDRVLVQLHSTKRGHFSMKVSCAADRLARTFDEVVQSQQQEARSLLGRMCHLFAILRPYVQGGLRSHLGRCGLFVTDVMFLLHQLRQLPVEYRPVKQMKVLEQRGQDELWAMLKHQEESLVSALQPVDLLGLSSGESYVASEAALGAAGEQAKRIARALSEVLPQVVLRKVTLHLLGAFCEELLQKLLCPRAQEAVPFAGAGLSSGVAQVGRWLDTLATGAAGGDEFREVLAGLKKGPKGPSDAAAKEAPEGTAICVLSAEEISSAVTLMTSAQSMVRQTLQAAALPLDQRLQEEVPGYERLLLSSDLLGSDFSRFLERRLKLAKSMSKEEAMRLMSLSFHDEALPSEDAWRILSAG
ncbi:unnamed protein product [Durusdinium trenchii]|uniref:2-epi-5-epi-valiolone synthase n=2 Tax=Durusdinium trenchii TaxID=1381693 RepID=A0ABP0IKK9_9DINO